MRFNRALKVDFKEWTSVKLEREDNSAKFKTPTFGNKEPMPKFGAGSEYGREEREEARRQKYGMNRKKYKVEDQPWLLQVGDKKHSKDKESRAKLYKGLKEGGVSENTSYFIFTQAKDGHFDVYPIKQWYNFTQIKNYKTLSAEEAEEEFSKRNKIMNLFSVMVRKRMKVDEEEEGDMKKNQVNKALKMSEMEDWDDDGDNSSAESGDEDKDKDGSSKKKKAAKKIAKKKKNDSDEEPLEESDDGDEEGRELDYISDSSEPSEDEETKKPELPSVEEEEKHGDATDSSASEAEEEEKTEETEKVKVEEEKKKPKKKKKEVKEEVKAEVKPDSGDDEPEDIIEKSEFVPMESDTTVKEEGGSLKRKASDILLASPTKKSKVEVSSSLLTLASSEGITEEAVRKYLFRKPMTVAELLQKFKPKKTKIPNEDMVPIIAHILKKINPQKRTQNSKMYFFLKT